MPVVFHMLEISSRAPREFQTSILASLRAAAAHAQTLLPPLDADVVVFEEPKWVIPRLGVGGSCFARHRINVTYDSSHPHFQTHHDAELRSTLFHELHHCARPDYGETLGEAFVSEGLACVFEEECGMPTPFYAVECRGKALRSFSERALPQLGITNFSFGDWLVGRLDAKDSEFPYLCGYALGYAIVKAWLTQAGTTAAKAFDVKVETVLEAWRSGKFKPGL